MRVHHERCAAAEIILVSVATRCESSLFLIYTSPISAARLLLKTGNQRHAEKISPF